jgi:hypothetical protein
VGLNTYVAVGNKDDMSNLIINISPDDTPITKAIGRGDNATARVHSWLEDTLPDPRDNAVVEGAEFEVEDPGTRTELSNYTQIMRRGYRVTGSQEKTLKYGLTSEIAYQMRKAMKAMSLDIEKAIIENETAVQGSATVARKMGGIPYFVTTNVNDNSGVARVITEEILNDGLQSAWDAGGNPRVVVVSGGNKRIISNWTTNVDRTFPVKDTKLTRKIDVYESDFGVVKIIPDRWMPNDKIYILDTEYWGLSFFRPVKKYNLPKTGDSEKQILLGELTLEGKAEKASAIISDLALSV